MDDLRSSLARCQLCPRECSVNRLAGERGYCGAGPELIVAHWGLHFGEEPPISGTKGSGNVFFSPCNLRCSFCQNHQISHKKLGRQVSVEELVDCFFHLERAGAHNINLVSPTPYVPLIVIAITKARCAGLRIPFVYNTNAYESRETLSLLDGLIEVYLPDLKYRREGVARKLSGAPDYPSHAMAAILQMKEQVGDLKIEGGIAQKGLLIRHLVLPAALAGSRGIIGWIKENLGAQTFVSLMSQYYPTGQAELHPMINRRIKPNEYYPLIDILSDEGFENVFVQELESAPVFLPDFTRDDPFDEQIPNHKFQTMFNELIVKPKPALL